MKKLALHWQVIIGMVVGALVAYAAIILNGMEVSFGGQTYLLSTNQIILDYLKPFGDIFINLLKLIAVPMVLFSIISGVASMKDIKKLGRMGVKTLLTYVVTTMIAVVVGLILVNVLQPGTKVSDDLLKANRIRYELWVNQNDKVNVLDDRCEMCKDENKALVEEIRAQGQAEPGDAWLKSAMEQEEKNAAQGPLQPLVDVVPKNIFSSLADSSMLQIIFFAIFFAIVLISLPEDRAKPVTKLIDVLNEIFVKMVYVVMKAMPFFVFALMAGQIVKAAGSDADKFAELLQYLLVYSLTVVLGLIFMIFIFYPTLVQMVVKKLSYGQFLRGMRDAQITAFSTSSSVATLPITIQCVDKKLGVPESTSSFVLPIGATVNMDGTSLYQAVAVVSLAQFHMVDLTLGQQATIVLTATLASIGAAAIPSAGLVLMIIVLESVGLNPAWIALIFPVDRILDMCRTVVNVTGDGAVCSIIANSEGEIEPHEIIA